jgi:hypothetical protein
MKDMLGGLNGERWQKSELQARFHGGYSPLAAGTPARSSLYA